MAKKKPERKTRKDKQMDIVKTTINVPEKLLFEFRVIALREKRYMGEILREFMEQYVKEKKA